MNKRLVHTKVVREAQDLLAEALSPRRRIKPGMIVRYYEHGHVDPSDPHSEVTLLTGYDRVVLIHPKEPRIELQLLGRRVFKDSCCLYAYDAHYKNLEKWLDAKIAAKHHKATGKELA